MNKSTSLYVKDQTPEDLRGQAQTYREMADDLEQAAFEKQQEQMKLLKRERNDKLLKKNEAIDLLWFGSYKTLTKWRKKVNPIGYLRFEDGKILRSEVLRFQDDYYAGKIEQQLANRE